MSMACELFHDPEYRVLLVRLGSALTQPIILDMYAAAARFVAERGSHRGILDLAAVAYVDVTNAFIVYQAHRIPALAGQRRVLAAPDDELFGLCRMFAAHQEDRGDGPEVVREVSEAYARLGIIAPDFRPIAAIPSEPGRGLDVVVGDGPRAATRSSEMGRYKGQPSKASIEAAHPHAVWVRVPSFGLGERMNALHDAARGPGEYATTGRTHHSGDHVRFGFRAPEHAAAFRERATEICAELVEPGEPPARSDR